MECVKRIRAICVLDRAARLHMCEDYSFPAEAKIDGSLMEESHRCMARNSKQGEESCGNPLLGMLPH